MKINQEAWTAGNELGWDDGYNDVLPKPELEFKFPSHYSESEKQFFIDGYNKGYEQEIVDI